jgi:hypothetical protein
MHLTQLVQQKENNLYFLWHYKSNPVVPEVPCSHLWTKIDVFVAYKRYEAVVRGKYNTEYFLDSFCKLVDNEMNFVVYIV